MDVFKIDQSMGGLGSGSRVTESSRHHQVTTEVSFDTTSDFNLSFFDSSSTPPTPPAAPTGANGVSSSSASSTSSSGVIGLKEEYDEPSPQPQDAGTIGGGSGGVFDTLGSDMFNSPPPATPPSPSLDSTDSGGGGGVKIKSEFDVASSFNSRAGPAPRPSLNLFPPPKTGSNPPPTPPSTPITLKNGKWRLASDLMRRKLLRSDLGDNTTRFDPLLLSHPIRRNWRWLFIHHTINLDAGPIRWARVSVRWKRRGKKQSKVVERREGAGRFYLHPNVEGEKKRKGKICERKFNDLATNKSVMGSCWTIVSFSSDDSSTSIRTPPHEESCVARQMLMTATPTAIGCGAD